MNRKGIIKNKVSVPASMVITIIGTSHIAKQSIKDVQEAIEQGKPDIIALELDRKRLPALLAKERQKVRISDIGRIGIKGFLFAALGSWAERKLGESVGVKPGAEMKLAFRLAKKNSIRIALIDQDIDITLRRISTSLTWKEKFRFLGDVCGGFFGKKHDFLFDLSTVPKNELIARMLEKVRTRYPSIHRVLIDERNMVMIKNIKRLRDQNQGKKILVIVGAGHKVAIEGALDKENNVSVSYSLPQGMALSMDG